MGRGFPPIHGEAVAPTFPRLRLELLKSCPVTKLAAIDGFVVSQPSTMKPWMDGAPKFPRLRLKRLKSCPVTKLAAIGGFVVSHPSTVRLWMDGAPAQLAGGYSRTPMPRAFIL